MPPLTPLQLCPWIIIKRKILRSLVLANWDAKLTLGNHDAHLKIFFDPLTCIVYYKEGPISCASIVEPIHLGPMIQKTVHIRFDRMGCGGEQPFVEDQVLKGIVEDGASGTLQYSVRMHIKADYGISVWLYNMVIKSQCPDLKVEFVASNGEGKIIGGQHNCSAPLVEF